MGLRSAFDLLLSSDRPLVGINDLIWQSLSAGATSKKHPWNEGTFTTVEKRADDFHPKSRTVILRRANPSTRSIDFFTDARSAKVDELNTPNVGWLFYVAATQIQLRMEGTAQIVDGREADEAWVRTPVHSRSAYLSVAVPGKEVDSEAPPDISDRTVSLEESERGRQNFRIVRTNVRSAEWLYLNQGDHVRVRLRYEEDGAVNCVWLVP